MTARLAYEASRQHSHSNLAVNKFDVLTLLLRDVGVVGLARSRADRDAVRTLAYRIEQVRTGRAAVVGPDVLRPVPTRRTALVADRDWDGGIESVARDATAEGIEDLLPEAYRAFLNRLDPEKRARRLAAIERKVPREHLEWLALHPAALAAAAAGRAKAIAKATPHEFEANLGPEGRRRRSASWWHGQMRSAARKADLYVSAAVGAVGGTAKYVSSFTLGRDREQREESRRILDRLRLVQRENPLIQVPVAPIAEEKARRHAAETRMLIDVHLHRAKVQGMRLCWITLTLPGEWHPHSTNEDARSAPWDEDLGPVEAVQEMRIRYKRVMALSRKRGIRPCGFWSSQPQQDGTPHVHLAFWCRSLDEARGLCDAVKAHFPGEREAKAFVMGDTNPRYRPPMRRDTGEQETAESVARYVARYAARESAAGGDVEEGSSAERVRAWLTANRLRSLTFTGTRRGGIASWRTLMAAAMRGETGTSLRTRLAIERMKAANEWSRAAGERRRLGDYEAASAAAEQAAKAGYEAALAAGLWPDADLTEEEAAWLREECDGDEAEPIAVHEERENKYGERVKKFIGIRAADAEEDDGIIRLREHEWELLEISDAEARAKDVIDSRYGEGTEKAERTFALWKEAIENQRVSLIPTCPRRGPAAPAGPERSAAVDPPGGPP